jgi:hypothetical protein
VGLERRVGEAERSSLVHAETNKIADIIHMQKVLEFKKYKSCTKHLNAIPIATLHFYNKIFATKPHLTIFRHIFSFCIFNEDLCFLCGIRVEQILQTHKTKKLYIPNKLYELTEQIYVCSVSSYDLLHTHKIYCSLSL